MEVRCQEDGGKRNSQGCGCQDDQGFKRNFKDDEDTLQDGARLVKEYQFTRM